MPRQQPEFRLHCLIAAVLRLQIKPGHFAFHSPNGEHRSVRTGGKLKRMLVIPGVPDFTILRKDKPTIGLELKAAGAYQSAEQRAVEALWKAAGADYVVVKSYRAAIDFLEAEDVIRPVRDNARFAPRQTAEAA